MNEYDKSKIVSQLQQAISGRSAKEEDVGFSSKIDGANGTVYCNIFGRSYTEKDVLEAYEYFEESSARHTALDDDQKKLGMYEERASLCIKKLLDQK